VVTAVYADPPYRRELADSVLGQPLPRGWDLEWLIQEDGPATERVTALTTRDRRCRTAANGIHRGTASTRNAALVRATGRYVRVLDQDDVLLPGSLADPIRVLEDHPMCTG
jgi:glycosyltransferase involved in cell wall biosynthesis